MLEQRLFIGIPCYQESESLARTLGFLKERTVLPHTLKVQVAKQSVVKNKNALLAEAKKLRPEYVCLCDDDIEPQMEWDRKLIDSLEYVQNCRGIRIGQTSPRLIYPDGKIFCSWIDVCIYSARAKQVSATPFKNLRFDLHMGDQDKEVYRSLIICGALPGTLTIFTREFLDSVKWSFDERYERSQCEDVDQSFTCRELNFSLLYNGLVEVIHHTSGINPRSMRENHAKLWDKWRKRVDLTMVIPNTQETVGALDLRYNSAMRRPFVSRNVFARTWNLLRKNTFHRLRTGASVIWNGGFRGIAAHVRRIELESISIHQK